MDPCHREARWRVGGGGEGAWVIEGPGWWGLLPLGPVCVSLQTHKHFRCIDVCVFPLHILDQTFCARNRTHTHGTPFGLAA